MPIRSQVFPFNSESQPTGFFSPEPQVRLVNAFHLPYDNAVATARTCYSSNVIYASDVNKDEATKERRDAIAHSIYLAGHHTTLQHASFQFVIEQVSRQTIWSFLHSHPFYNSEQVSQRYVAVQASNFAVPPLSESAKKIYLDTVQSCMTAYQKLGELLKPTIEREYIKIFPHRDLKEKKWQSSLKKRAQEIARYILPVATHAHLYHTISGVTLLRYRRLCEIFDSSFEQKIVVSKMVQEVEKWDPEFFKFAEDPLPLEETPEYQYFSTKSLELNSKAKEFVAEFDKSLGDKRSLLVDYKVNAEKVMADSVRNVLGEIKSDLSDDAAIDLVLNPEKDSYLSQTLNLTTLGKLTRAMVHPHFTFRKKISHTADSQDQRHRTVPGSRPILSKHLMPEADYIIPELINLTPLALEFYTETMETIWKNIFILLNLGVPIEYVLYLLPNAFPIRFEESGALIDFHHKWVHRLCYTAQEEIWRTCLEETQQVQTLFPMIGKYLFAPCTLRKLANRKPFCPEGDRFCGIPVWKQNLNEYQRIL